MNMLFETMRSGLSSVIVVPSSALESMNLGALGGLVSITTRQGREPKQAPADRLPGSDAPVV